MEQFIVPRNQAYYLCSLFWALWHILRAKMVCLSLFVGLKCMLTRRQFSTELYNEFEHLKMFPYMSLKNT